MRGIIGALALVAALAPAGGTQAAPVRDSARVTATQPRDSALEARTSAVASELRCPVCQGLSIQDSPSELAQSMRAVVRDQLAAGRTPDEVKAYYVGRYGEWILLKPKASGFNLIAYALPVLAVVCGGIGIAVAVRRWTTPRPGTAAD